MLGLVLLGCSKEETNEARLARFDRECHAKVDKLVADAKPRVETFRKMLDAVDSLPPPGPIPADAKLAPAKIPIVQRDFVKAMMTTSPTRATGIHRYGAFLGDPWLEALAHAATFASEPRCGQSTSIGPSIIPAYGELASLDHVVIVKQLGFVEPEIHGDTFARGQVKGVAYVFEVASGRSIGGFDFEATSSETVDFHYRRGTDGGSGDKAEQAKHVALTDLGLRVDDAIRPRLGAK